MIYFFSPSGLISTTEVEAEEEAVEEAVEAGVLTMGLEAFRGAVDEEEEESAMRNFGLIEKEEVVEVVLEVVLEVLFEAETEAEGLALALVGREEEEDVDEVFPRKESKEIIPHYFLHLCC